MLVYCRTTRKPWSKFSIYLIGIQSSYVLFIGYNNIKHNTKKLHRICNALKLKGEDSKNKINF